MSWKNEKLGVLPKSNSKIKPWERNGDWVVVVPNEVEATISLELPWPPVTGNHAVRHAAGRHFLTKEILAYNALIASRLPRYQPDSLGALPGPPGASAGHSQGGPLVGPLHVDWLLAPPDRRGRDVDNLRKTVADSLTKAGFWADDSNKVIRRELFEWADPVNGGAISLTVRVMRKKN